MNLQKLNEVETYTNLWNNFKAKFHRKKKDDVKQETTDSNQQTNDERPSENVPNNDNENTSHEIDFLKLGITIVKSWKSLLVFIILSGALGVVVAFNTPKAYTASVILAPEVSGGGMGLSGGLADMASNLGIDLDKKSGVDAIYPDLYPDVLASPDFILKLFDVPVRLQDNDTLRTYKNHLLKDAPPEPFWSYPATWLSKKLKGKRKKVALGTGDTNNEFSSMMLPEDDYKLCDNIKGLITCAVDKKTSVITINVQDGDPLVAAIMADTVQARLQEYITNYRTQKSIKDYKYFQKLADESKEKYVKAQQAYAKFCDENVDAELQSIQSKRDQLENEMQLRYNVYTQMQGQAQQYQAKIRERTPVFTIIQNARMPYKPSSTPRSMIALVFVFFGIMLDALWVLVREFKKNKKKENS